MNPLHLSTTDRWFTPSNIVEAARVVLGGIDLDPASEAVANETVRASRYFTMEDNGLQQEWGGRIFLNPPGGRGMAQAFWAKLVTSRIEHAVFVGFSIEILQNTQAKSYPSLSLYTICIPKKRIKFVGNGKSPTHANVIAYVPGTIDATYTFEETFREFGQILAPVTRGIASHAIGCR